MKLQFEILRSRLGKRIIIFMLLAGLVPLVVFTAPLYFQSYGLMKEEAEQTMEDYTNLATGQLFQTLKQGEHQLIRYAQTLETPPASENLSFFSTMERLESVEGILSRTKTTDWNPKHAIAELKQSTREILLTPAYLSNGSVTVSLITIAPDGAIWLGEIRPEILWEVLRGSTFRKGDIVTVLNEENFVLASSRNQPFRPMLGLNEIFTASPDKIKENKGTGEVDGMSKVVWVSKPLWLTGAFGAGEWKMMFFREQQQVQALTMVLLESLGLWLIVALSGLVLISFRFARQLYEPIEKLISATTRLTEGDWETEISVNTGDELEVLSDHFNKMKSTIQTTNTQLQHDATHDQLTGLPNRVMLESNLQDKINFTHRHRDYSFALIFLDLDRFKVINDSLGHKAGDLVLKEVAKRFENKIRETDLLVRIGGDEFVIILDSIMNTGQAVKVIEQITAALDQPIEVEDQNVFIGTSIGITIHNDSYDTPEAMLRDADTAMYQAKKKSDEKSYVVFGQMMRNEAQSRLDMETALRTAIKDNQFVLHYQPFVDIQTGQIRGVEALIRWDHPTQGNIPPLDFIPLAEEIGLINEIGGWTLRESHRQFCKWQTQIPGGVEWISLNISPKQLFNDSLLKEIDRIQNEDPIDRDSIKLEVTESVLISNMDRAVSVLNELRSRGFPVCMDDFGTGHSSLSLLQKLPIDVLKVDREFIQDIHLREDCQAIVAAVTGLASKMELKIVAEGIETKEELEFLSTMDCDLAQGFYFSNPIPAEELEKIMLKKTGTTSYTKALSA